MRQYIVLSQAEIITLLKNKPVSANINDVKYIMCSDECYEQERKGEERVTYKERQSCIHTIKMLRQLAFNIHGVIDEVDNRNCNKLIELLEGGIDEIYQEHYRQGLKDAAEKPETIFDPDER